MADNYNPYFLADEIAKSGGLIKAAAIRKDYSHLRKIAQSRLSRFEGTEWQNSQTYRQYRGKFKRLDEIKSAEELAFLLSDVKKFLDSPAGGIIGLKRQRAEIIETMHSRGYTWVTKKNFNAFTRFMDKLRQANLSRFYDSDRIGEIVAQWTTEKVENERLMDDFLYFLQEEAKSGNTDIIYRKSAEDIANLL